MMRRMIGAIALCSSVVACNAILGNDDHLLGDTSEAGIGDGTGNGGSEGGTTTAEGGSSGMDAAVQCTENALSCNGLQPQKCVHNAWTSVGPACDFVCSGGVCTGECKPSTKQCSDLVTSQTCNPTGQWVTSACGSAVDGGAADAGGDGGAGGFCNGAGICGVCQSGTTQCDGNGVQTCSPSGAWGAAVACMNACYQGGCTGICTPGTTQCVSTTPQTCSSVGSWVSQPIMSGMCTAICTPGTASCSGTTPRTCNASGTGYLNGSVMAGVCGAQCTPGSSQCVGTTPQACSSSGFWTSQSIVKGTCGAICTPSSTQCVGTTQQTCNSTGTAWNNNAVTQGVCGAVCTPNELGCGNTEQSSFCGGSGCWWVWSNQTIYQETCNSAGAWGPAVTCTGKCLHPNGQYYYNCSTAHGGCVASGPCEGAN